MDDFDLEGRVAVVTGAGRGIGEAIARAFADVGAAVVLAARTACEIDAVASSIRQQGGRAIAVRADVTDDFALGTLATAAVEEFGHLDIWVNNAGGTRVGKPLTALSRREWNEVVELNFTAVWNGSMAAVEQMHWGSIINVSSMAAFGAMPGKGHYAACKAAVISLTRTMAVELAPDIRVNAIAPGCIPTKLLFDAIDEEGVELSELAARMPLGLGTPADVAAVAVFLASPAAKWITGQTLQVSGGVTIVGPTVLVRPARPRRTGPPGSGRVQEEVQDDWRSSDSSKSGADHHTRLMDFEIPADIQDTLDQLDAFIEAEIKPLEQQDDNIRFFDHRREWARTDFDNDGVPRADWEELLREMRRRADAAGWLRLALPAEFGGQDASNLKMAIIREHLAHKGLGLHNDLQNESSIVGNFPTVLMMRDFGTEQQRTDWMPGFLDGTRRLAFGLTEPNHGSDATYMETTAVRDGDEWVINGMKRWNSGLHHATHDIIFARTSGDPGSPKGISAFLVPTDAAGFKVDFFWWTFNMPTDHAEVSLTDVRVGADALFGEADRGLELAQHFVHENRIRQAASSLGAAQYCIDEAVAYANSRTTWGKKLSVNQGIQFPLVELHTEAAMLRQLVRYTATMLDQKHHMEVTHLVAMCNYRANRLACDAADRAMQTCGGVGYSRHMPFEHIYRHHRRYRITEGSEEIQMRKVGQHLFGFGRK